MYIYLDKYIITNGGQRLTLLQLVFFLLLPQPYKSSAFVAVNIKTSLKITILIPTIERKQKAQMSTRRLRR